MKGPIESLKQISYLHYNEGTTWTIRIRKLYLISLQWRKTRRDCQIPSEIPLSSQQLLRKTEHIEVPYICPRNIMDLCYLLKQFNKARHWELHDALQKKFSIGPKISFILETSDAIKGLNTEVFSFMYICWLLEEHLLDTCTVLGVMKSTVNEQGGECIIA